MVINATGVFTDSILRLDDPNAEPVIAPSQGVHLILDKEFLPGQAAILVPHTDDGRVLFAVPWHDKIIIGTTDTPVSQPTIEPRALPAEIDFILQQIGRYLQKVPTRKDIRSIFAGLAAAGEEQQQEDGRAGPRSPHPGGRFGADHDHGGKMDDVPADGGGYRE